MTRNIFEWTEELYHKFREEKKMVQVSGDLMNNPAIAKALQRPKYYPIFPICYCKLCKGERQRSDCPNKANPHPRPDSVWFRALRGEAISPVEVK